MAPAMPCKTCKKTSMGRPVARLMISSPNFACVLEAGESTRLLRVEGSLPNYYEVLIAGEGDNSLQHYNMGHKFIPMPQVMKIPAARAAVNKEWEKLGKIPTWDKTRVRNKSVCLIWRRLRVIHVIVKTEEMQKLRMKFVLYCTTWISNLNKIDHSICQQVDISTLGFKAWALRRMMSESLSCSPQPK